MHDLTLLIRCIDSRALAKQDTRPAASIKRAYLFLAAALGPGWTSTPATGIHVVMLADIHCHRKECRFSGKRTYFFAEGS